MDKNEHEIWKEYEITGSPLILFGASMKKTKSERLNESPNKEMNKMKQCKTSQVAIVLATLQFDKAK